MKLKIAEVTDPRFELELPNGETQSYDPYEVAEKIELLTIAATKEAEENKMPLTLARQNDTVRQAFDFPTVADAEKSPEPKPFTLSRHQCQWVQVELMDFIGNLDVSKKGSRVMQKS